MISLTGVGDGLTFTALPWLAMTLTGSVLLVSVVSSAVRLPWLLLSLPFGVLIDRWPRNRLMAIASILRAAMIALLALAAYEKWADLRWLMPVAFLFGTAKVLFESTAQTIVPMVVQGNQLERANGLFVTAQLITSDILGGAVGGLLVTIGLSVPFIVDAVAASLSILLLLGLQGSFTPLEVNRRLRFREDMVAGLAFLWRHPFLRGLAFFSMGMTAAFSAVVATQVFFMKEILGLNAFGFGLLISIATVGSVLGSQSVSWFKQRLGARRAMLLAILVMSLAYGLAGLSSHWAAVGVLYTIAAFFLVVWNVLNVSLRQRLVPDALLGRVGSVYRFVSWGISSLGMVLGGALVSAGERVYGRAWALRTPYCLLSALYALLLLVALRLLRDERLGA